MAKKKQISQKLEEQVGQDNLEDAEAVDDADLDDGCEDEETIRNYCPFCNTCFNDGRCHHLIAEGDDLPSWFNGYEAVEKIYDLYVGYQETDQIFDWKDYLEGLLLKKVVEENELDEFCPIQIFECLEGVDVQANMWTGCMISGIYFFVSVSDEFRDKWEMEFDILLGKILIHCKSEDWEGQVLKM